MFIDFLTPEVFDAIVVLSILFGVLLAGRRLRKDLRGPLPDDAPAWARARNEAQANNSTDRS